MDKKSKVELCHALHYLAMKNIKEVDNNSLSVLMKEALGTLISIACNQENYASLAAFLALTSVIEVAAKDTLNVLRAIYQQLMLGFNTILDPNFFRSPEMRYAYAGYVCSSFSAFIMNPNFDVPDYKDLFKNIILSFSYS